MSGELTTQSVNPMQLLSVAVSSGADIDKLTKLMDLQERWEANEARKAFTAAIAEFKRNPPDLVKDKQVAYGNTKYKHASLDQVTEKVAKALSAVGISHRYEIEQKEQIKVSCVLTHILGHSESTTLSAGADTSGQKNSIQAIGSTVTYLQRYTLLAAVGLSTGEDDNDAQPVTQKISDEQFAKLNEMIAATNTNAAQFCKYFKIAKLDDLSANAFEDAMSLLRKKADK